MKQPSHKGENPGKHCSPSAPERREGKAPDEPDRAGSSDPAFAGLTRPCARPWLVASPAEGERVD